MPKGIGYGKKKKRRRTVPKAPGRRKAHTKRKQPLKGKASPVIGLRRLKKKRRTLKKL